MRLLQDFLTYCFVVLCVVALGLFCSAVLLARAVYGVARLVGFILWVTALAPVALTFTNKDTSDRMFTTIVVFTVIDIVLYTNLWARVVFPHV